MPAVVRQFPVFRAKTRKIVPKTWDWLAGDAVESEPVSAPFFLLTGKNTGKFIKASRYECRQCAKYPMYRGLSTPVGDLIEQGIARWETGKSFSETGNFAHSRAGPCPPFMGQMAGAATTRRNRRNNSDRPMRSKGKSHRESSRESSATAPLKPLRYTTPLYVG